MHEIRPRPDLTPAKWCSSGAPWHPGGPVPVCHPDAKATGETADDMVLGKLERVKCPHCRVAWWRQTGQ